MIGKIGENWANFAKHWEKVRSGQENSAKNWTKINLFNVNFFNLAKTTRKRIEVSGSFQSCGNFYGKKAEETEIFGQNVFSLSTRLILLPAAYGRVKHVKVRIRPGIYVFLCWLLHLKGSTVRKCHAASVRIRSRAHQRNDQHNSANMFQQRPRFSHPSALLLLRCPSYGLETHPGLRPRVLWQCSFKRAPLARISANALLD